MQRLKAALFFAGLVASLVLGADGVYAEEAAPAPPPPAPGDARITLKFTRAAPGPDRPLRLVQASCPTCVQRFDADFARENLRETIVELDVPKDRYLELSFDGDPKAFGRVILQSGDAPLRTEAGGLVVDLPPLQDDAVEAGEVATHIAGDGYVMRFEHADPARAAGAYAKAFPDLQRRAANALEFAERGAVIELGLGEQVKRQEWGVIEIMGFDTNNPHGHLDAPPHMHMHLRWPYNTGTQIGHFYISDHGRLTQNRVGITGYRLPTRTFAPGEPFATLTPKGETAYTQTITADGGLDLMAADGRACRIEPAGAGFQDGATVACDGRPTVEIQVSDDLARGVIEARTGAIREVFRYDRETGALISPSAPPGDVLSAINPTYEMTPP